jgi:hypothetical protein
VNTYLNAIYDDGSRFAKGDTDRVMIMKANEKFSD